MQHLDPCHWVRLPIYELNQTFVSIPYRYAVRNVANGSTRFATCRYRDTTDLGLQEEALDEPGATKHAERSSFYCVSIPGEAPWVKDIYKKQEPMVCHPSTSLRASAGSIKRVRDDDDDITEEMKTQKK